MQVDSIPGHSGRHARMRPGTRQIAILAGAGALAFSVLIGGGQRQEGDLPARTAPASEAQTRPVSLGKPGEMVVYIVGSRAEKETLEGDGAFKEWFSEPATNGLPDVAMRAVVIEPGQEESLGLLAELLPESGIATGNGPKLMLVDLR